MTTRAVLLSVVAFWLAATLPACSDDSGNALDDQGIADVQPDDDIGLDAPPFDLGGEDSDATEDLTEDTPVDDSGDDVADATADVGDDTADTHEDTLVDAGDDAPADAGTDSDLGGGDVSDAGDVSVDGAADAFDAKDEIDRGTPDFGSDAVADGGTDGGVEPGACCSVNETPGCDEPTTEACVCDLEPSCCDEAWTALCVSWVEAGACAVCQAVGDVNEVNDSPAQATPVGLDFRQVGLSIHSSSDADWFTFTLDDESGVLISLLFLDSQGDIDVIFYNGSLVELGVSESGSNNEFLSFPLLTPGTYYLYVYGWNGQTNPNYEIRIEGTEPPDLGTLFSDLTVSNLQDPRLLVGGGGTRLGLLSYLPNVGTAPAPGAAFGNAYASFRLIDAETGEVALEGVKGPIFLTNNGGCTGEAYSMWLLAGQPEIPGTEVAITNTSPGCVDIYVQSTNAATVPPFVVSGVPDGNYLYELNVNHDGAYAFEPRWALGNNVGWVPLTLSTTGGGSRQVTQTGTIQRGGRVTIDSGVAETVLGSGAALGELASNFAESAAIGRPVALDFDAADRLLVTLFDDGSLVRDAGDGTWDRLATGLDGPWGLAVLADGDVVVAESGGDRLIRLEGDDDFLTRSELVVSGATLVEPTDLRLGPDGRLYVANAGAHEVLAVALDTGDAVVVAGTGTAGYEGDGLATEVPLSWPTGLTFTEAGVLVIAEAHNNRLRALNLGETAAAIGLMPVPPGEIVTLVGQGPTAAGASLSNNTTNGFAGERRHGRSSIIDWPFSPRALGDRVFFLDGDNHRLRCYDEYGALNVVVGNAPLPGSNGPRTAGSADEAVGDGGPGLDADLNRPLGLALVENEDGSVDLYIADSDNYRVRRIAGVTLEALSLP